LVTVEGDLMNVGSESVGVVAQRVFDRAEDLFGWRVGERLGHLACPLFQERLETVHQVPDAGLTVFGRCARGAIGVGHDKLAERGFAGPEIVWPTPLRFAPIFSGRTLLSGRKALPLDKFGCYASSSEERFAFRILIRIGVFVAHF
jgi:hypothetical protein